MKKLFLTLGLVLLGLTVVINARQVYKKSLAGSLTPEQEAILGLLEIVQIDDGYGGTVQALRISSNLQVVNGLGNTYKTNGLGNIIVGYNERGGIEDRQGSHNIVMGMSNSYSSHSTAVFGYDNETNAPGGSILGGGRNTSSGIYSVIVGGEDNNITGPRGWWSVVSGGLSRTALGDHDWVAGPLFQDY